MGAPAQQEVLLVSCYELGHQPLAVASAAAFLERAGHKTAAVDLSIEPFERLDELCGSGRFGLVAISAPMHTALRIGTRAAERVRQAASGAHVCIYGLYATLNAEYLLDGRVDSVIGGEFEQPLLSLADALGEGRAFRGLEGVQSEGEPATPYLRKTRFAVPDRSSLPAPERYAALEVGGRRRQAAAVEASRGCLHDCSHCPIPPVYGKRFFVVPQEVVLEDVRSLAGRGISHITFADPDFFNGPGHSLALARAMHAEFPELTFDFTTKVEHVLEYRDHLGQLAACGALFAVSAVESLSDAVLRNLRKGHTRADVSVALGLLRDAGIDLRPSLVAFTPWTRIEDFLEILEWVAEESLVDHVDAVQLSIRLLVPPGSLLAESEAMRPHLRGLVLEDFSHTWEHPDPRMDRLQRTISAIVEDAATAETDPAQTFSRIFDAAHAAAARVPPHVTTVPPGRATARPPRLTEPWFC